MTIMDSVRKALSSMNFKEHRIFYNMLKEDWLLQKLFFYELAKNSFDDATWFMMGSIITAEIYIAAMPLAWREAIFTLQNVNNFTIFLYSSLYGIMIFILLSIAYRHYGKKLLEDNKAHFEELDKEYEKRLIEARKAIE